MRYTNTLLIIALLTFQYANSFEFASLAEVAEINQTPYGKSLLETISLSLENKGNVNEVQQLLNDLLYKLNKDQDEDTATWTALDRRLRAKIAALIKEIERLRLEILRLAAELAKYEKLRDKAAANLIQYKKQLAANLKSLQNNDKRRAEDLADFKRSQAEHADMLNAIDAVVKELRKLIGSISGKFRPSHVKENKEEQRDRLAKAFLQLEPIDEDLKAFVEVATEVDQNALKNLIKKLREIRATTQASYNDDVAHEKNSEKMHKQLKELLTNDNKQLNSMIAQETRNHAAYVKKVAELKTKIFQTRKLRKAKQVELKTTQELRDAEERKYRERKAQRDEERRVIVKIQKIVATRLARMSAYLKQQVD